MLDSKGLPVVATRRVDPGHPAPETISWAAAILEEGGIVVYPTETFYGLGANPFLEAAIERIFAVKGREAGKPLPLIASDAAAARSATAQWPPVAERLSRSFWPGPLTLVLPASPKLPHTVHSGTGKIAVRISSHPVAHALSAAVGGLLVATSANPAGAPPHADPDSIPSGFLAHVDGLLHAGPTAGDLPSTIVDLSVEPPRLLRSGCLPWEQILEAL